MSLPRFQTRIEFDNNGKLNVITTPVNSDPEPKIVVLDDTPPATIIHVTKENNETETNVATENKKLVENNHSAEEKIVEPVNIPINLENIEAVSNNEKSLWESKAQQLLDNLFTPQGPLVNQDIVRNLNKLRATLLNEGMTPSNAIVMDHFLNVTEELKAGKVFTADDVIEDTKNLDKKLNGLRPLSARVVGAIAGVVGAIIGFAIGITLGAIATHGVAAIPAGIISAFKGFTLGVQMAAFIGASTGLLAGMTGFFSAYRKERNYMLYAEPTDRVLNNVNSVTLSLTPRV